MIPKVALFSAGLFVPLASADAALILQTNFNPAGSGGSAAYWNTPSMWSDGLAPDPLNDYESRTQVANIGSSFTLNGINWNYRGQIRDTNGGTPVTSTFGGGRLILTADTRLLLKGKGGTTSTASIVLQDDSHIFLAPDSGGANHTSTLAGSIQVADGAMTAIGIRSNGGETLNITSTISGGSGATMQMVVSGGQVNHLRVNGDYSNFGGTFYLGTPTTGDSPVTAAGSTFAFAAGSAAFATLHVTTHANIKFDLNSNVSFGAIILGTNTTLTEGTYNYQALSNLGFGSAFLDNGGTLTVVPEASTAALAGLAALGLLRRRRI